MKKFLFGALFATILCAGVANAQATASGTLTVTATVNGSISLVFNTDPSGVALTGTGTNTATLAFGNVSAYVPLAANVGRTVLAGTSFTVSTPVDANVTAANLTSANYTLKAQLNTVDAVNTWQVGGTTVTNAAAATITATGTYGANVPQSIALTIPFSTTSGTTISNSINFTATAN